MKKLLAMAICVMCIVFVSVQAEKSMEKPVEKPDSKVVTGSQPAEGVKTGPDGKQDSSAINSGVEVHGHWTIEVLDKEGKRVSINEFNNALSNSYALSHMLGPGGSEYGSYGGWLVGFQGTPQPCGPNGCLIYSNPNTCAVSSSMEPHSTNLTQSLEEQSMQLYAIILNGSVISDTNTSIQNVFTMVKTCKDTILPSNCINEGNSQNCTFRNFTWHTLQTAIPVLAGQQVLVTVEISFS